MHAEGVSVLSADRTSGHGILQQASLAREHMQRVLRYTHLFPFIAAPLDVFALEIEDIRGAAQHDPHQIHMELKNMSGGTGGMLAK